MILLRKYLVHVITCACCLLIFIPQTKAQLYPGITVNSQLFSDDIWFFGTYAAPYTGCAGVMFKKEGSKYVVYDYSGKGKVNSWENSLSVSTPSCDGKFVFYTMHNQVYNANHVAMDGGSFAGDNSIADGLAACYVGQNKYLFMSASATGGNAALNAYIIDMSQNSGLGKMTFLTAVEANGMSESIELMPVANTTDEYWLVYRKQTGHNTMNVRRIKGNNGSPTISNILYSIGTGSADVFYSYVLKSNATYNRLVLCDSGTRFFLYDFNPTTGQIQYNQTLTPGFVSYPYGADFSPSGRYLYMSSYRSHEMRQYDLTTNTYNPIFRYNSAASVTAGAIGGGGLKRGPDGKMYVAREGTTYLGVIEKPNEPSTTPGFYNENGLLLSTKYTNLPLSTGITPPAVDPVTSTPPTANPDVGSTNQYLPVTINVLANDNKGGGTTLTLTNAFFNDPSKAEQGEIAINATNGTITFTPNPRYDYSGANATVSITYVAQNNSTPIPMCGSGTLTITVTTTHVRSTLFSDDVWFFGQNTGATEGSSALGNAKTSKGIIFRNKGGIMVPEDASGISSVNSWENSLSISTPACDGSFIFYVQHDMIYNSNHENMQNGSILGHTSTGDGLAAAYLGDNKYFLASVSTANQGILQYSIVDMSKQNGLGEKISTTTIDNSGVVAEAIEMIPVVDTYNQYWLIYCLRGAPYTFVVKKVDGTNPSSPVITEAGRITIPATTMTNQNVWRMHSSPDYSIIAINASNSTLSSGAYYNHYFFNFNPQTGVISYNRAIDTRGNSHSSYSSYVFYDKYLYLSESQSGGVDAYYIYQYDMSTPNWNKVAQFKITNTPASAGGSQSWQGGGMKMGPDGKIYFIRQSSYYSGVIKDPSKLLTTAGNVDENGFKHKYNGMGLTFSTGLTPPWINPPSSNHEPSIVDDVATTTSASSVAIKPLENDSDSDGDDLNLVGVEFATTADAAKGTVTFNASTKEVIFTPSTSHPFTDNEKVNIIYTVRDNGLPVALCTKGNIEITIKLAKLSVSLSDTEVDEGNEVEITICMPDGTVAPSGGLAFTLNRVASSTAEAADYQIIGTAKIPAGEKCITLKIKATEDNLLEIDDEMLTLNATATGYIALNQVNLTIKDKTDGTIVVEVASPASAKMAEPSTSGSFRVKFKDANVTTAKKIKVTFTLAGAVSGVDYEPVSPMEVELQPGDKEAIVPITVRNNYIVQGSRDLKIELTSAAKTP